MKTPNRNEIIQTEAIEHLLRLVQPGKTTNAADVVEFNDWLTRSPVHVEAFLAAAATWRVLDDATRPELANLDELIALARAQHDDRNVVVLAARRTPILPSKPLGSRRVAKAIAAAVLPLIAFGSLWYGYVLAANTYSNNAAEVRRIVLPDGSEVMLNPNSRIYLRWTDEERRLDLKKGRARFRVAHNPARPFYVQTELSAVRAVGTVFDVEAHARETKIAVLEGRVAVEEMPDQRGLLSLFSPQPGNKPEPDGESLQLGVGEYASVAHNESSGSAAPSSIMAWTSQQVVFRTTPLVAVVDELNRYHVRRVVIDDSSLGTLIISGVFNPREPELLLQYLELYEGVRVSSASDGSVLLSRREAPAKQSPGV